MGDGSVSLILDVAAMMTMMVERIGDAMPFNADVPAPESSDESVPQDSEEALARAGVA